MSAISRLYIRLIDQVQSMMNYYLTLKLEYSIPSLSASKFDIACDRIWWNFILNATILTGCSYIRIDKLFLKNDDVFKFFMPQSMRNYGSNNEHGLGLVLSNDLPSLATTREDWKLLDMATDKKINSTSSSLPLNFQS